MSHQIHRATLVLSVSAAGGILGQHRSLNASCRRQGNQQLPNLHCLSRTMHGLHKVHLRNYDLHLANRTRHRENEAPMPFLLCHPKFQMTWEGQRMINATTLCTRLSAADCTIQKRLNTPVPHSLTGRTKQNLKRYSRHHRDTQGCCP